MMRLRPTLTIHFLLVFLVGFVPSMVISLAAPFLLIGGMQQLGDGLIVSGLLLLVPVTLVVFGTVALGQYLFNVELKRIRFRIIAGLIGMTLLVLGPFLRVLLDSFGVDGLLPREGLALAAGAMTSLVCVAPAVVYAFLTKRSLTINRL
ncbi:MAG: hypothetical protein QNJ14_03970 [Woeseiaceae bacterium]|nr:hypothetical protein [Woeseiaceae bacterium]